MKLFVVGGLIVASIGAAIFLKNGKLEEQSSLTNASSDTTKYERTITIQGDAFEGYGIAHSDYMKGLMRRSKYRLKWVDDGADYGNRMKALKGGDADFAMLEIGAYVIEGEPYKYPASVIAVIDVSNGADAIVARKSVFANLEDLRNNPSAKVGLTLNSPSDVFAKTASVHFDIDALRKEENYESATGSEEVMKMLMKGIVDVGVVWEPELSKLLASGDFVKLISTKESKDTVVDALAVNRKFGEENPDVVKKVLSMYFQSLKHYSENPDKLVSEIMGRTSLKESAVKEMVSGIKWVNLNENCKRWFACDPDDWSAQIKIVDTLEKANKLWHEFDMLEKNVFPQEDAYTLINSEFMQDLMKNGVGLYSSEELENPLEKEFQPKTAAEWAKLKDFAKLKQRKILFVKNNELRLTSREAIDELAKDLEHYPNYRLRIEGHTGTLGDKIKNKSVSESRSKWVKRYLTQTYNVDEDRILTVGYGGEKPLKRKNGEGQFSRSYQSKLPRVSIVLMQEEY
jgi:outer membrane protein OmpA-like peptidoglycan-associated protein/ABC-type taurine transport system substrate-binding protein